MEQWILKEPERKGLFDDLIERQRIVAEIDRINKITETSLRKGMTIKQIEKILGAKLSLTHDSVRHKEYVLGRYKFEFRGGRLVKICPAGSSHPVKWLK